MLVTPLPDPTSLLSHRTVSPVVRHGDRSQDRPPWNLSSSNPQYRPSYSPSVGATPRGPHIVSLRSLPSAPALQGPSTQVHTVSPSETEPHTPRPGYIRHLITGPSYTRPIYFSTTSVDLSTRPNGFCGQRAPQRVRVPRVILVLIRCVQS